MTEQKTLESYCNNCVSKDVCKYTEDFQRTTIKASCPCAVIACSRFNPYPNNKCSSNLENIIRNWRIVNPNGRKVDCVKCTGISRPTVYKYWNCLDEKE